MKHWIRLVPIACACAFAAVAALDSRGAFASARSVASSGGITLCATPGATVRFSPSGACPASATALVVAANADLQALASQVLTLQGEVATLQGQVSSLQTLLAGVSRTSLFGQDTLRLSGMNVQIVNGSGSTSTVNGLGNLIIGYDESQGAPETTTGSHDLILGQRNSFSSYGGLVDGFANTISGPFASVSGGEFSTAANFASSVSGGDENSAESAASSVSGGGGNTTSGEEAWIGGGANNSASGEAATVSGGEFNTAAGDFSSILGGNSNNCSTKDCTVP
jgi:hypothetical protein